MNPYLFTNPSIGTAYQNDPRTAYAQALMQQGGSTAPVQSWGEGLARALGGALGGLQAGQVRQGYQDQDQQYQKGLTAALQGKDVLESLQNSGQPQLQQLALEYGLKTAQAKRQAQIEGAQKVADAQALGPVNAQNAALTAQATGPVNTQNAVAEAKALGPVNAQNAALTAQATAPVQTQQAVNQALALSGIPPREVQRTYKDITDAGGNVIGQIDDRGKKELFSNGITISPDGTITIGGSKNPNATAAQAASRGSLLATGIDAIKGVNFANISPEKMAIVGSAKSMLPGPAGSLAQAKTFNPDEQKLLAGQGAITEAVTAAITGAAYAPAQLVNYQNIFVPQAGEDPSVTIGKLQRAAVFLKQLDEMAGGSRLPVDQLPPEMIRAAVDKSIAMPAPDAPPAESPPVPGAKQAKDGNWYVPDPARPGSYLMVKP